MSNVTECIFWEVFWCWYVWVQKSYWINWL